MARTRGVFFSFLSFQRSMGKMNWAPMTHNQRKLKLKATHGKAAPKKSHYSVKRAGYIALKTISEKPTIPAQCHNPYSPYCPFSVLARGNYCLDLPACCWLPWRKRNSVESRHCHTASGTTLQLWPRGSHKHITHTWDITVNH